LRDTNFLLFSIVSASFVFLSKRKTYSTTKEKSQIRYNPTKTTTKRTPVQLVTLFVTSEHPDLDASVRQVGDSFRDAVLQFVFDGGRAKKRQVFLNLLVDFVQQSVAIHQRSAAPRSILL